MKKILKKMTAKELQEIARDLKKKQAKFKREQVKVRKEVNDKLIALITAAFGLVAALAWNDTIKAIFQRVFGTAQTVWAMVIYAVLVTVIAVWITYWMTKNKNKK